MPVLSPHRSSASPLTGSYRSTFSSSSGFLDRPYCSSANYTRSPRITSYSERYTSTSYTNADGNRIFSRSGSVTEDGVTTRFREDSREGSNARRDSLSRDSGIGSIREGSILDYSTSSGSRRDSSFRTNNDNPRLSTINVVDSVAELRNRYSPANYVPSCMRARNNDNLSRSKSINDIGLPPTVSESSKNAVKKKVNELNRNNSLVGIATNNSTNNGNNSPSSFTDNDDDHDDDNNNNGEEGGMRTSVAELRRRFGDDIKVTIEKSTANVKNNDNTCHHHYHLQNSQKGSCLSEGGTIKLDVNKGVERSGGGSGGSSSVEGSSNSTAATSTSTTTSTTITRNSVSSRVNDFASYIPTKNYQFGDVEDTKAVVPATTATTATTTTSIAATVTATITSSVSSICAGDLIGEDSDKRSMNDISSSKLSNNSLGISNRSPSSSLSSNSNSLTSTGSLRRSSESTNRRGSYEDETLPSTISNDRNRTSPARTLGLNGLKNIGNTCFMNSVIQCLSNTKSLLEYVRRDVYLEQINTTISGMKGALIKSFGEVIKELWSEDASDRVVNTSSLKSQIQRFAPRFIGYAQQDAQEFLRYFLEGLHEDVNRVTEKPKPILTEIDEKLTDNEKAEESWRRYLRMDNSWIVDCFVGQLKSTLKCTHCGHCSVTFDPFWDLSLPIPQRAGQVRLSQCLEAFTKEETLDGDEKPTCSKCKERRKCTKSFSIQKFPRILVIHLKRFSLAERFRGKLSVTVDFPLEGLDVSNYAADSVSTCRYNLYAVSNHSGTTYSGHYTAYCRHPYTRTWHEYNDSRVSSIAPRSIVSGEAYVLFYEQDGHQKSHL